MELQIEGEALHPAQHLVGEEHKRSRAVNDHPRGRDELAGPAAHRKLPGPEIPPQRAVLRDPVARMQEVEIAVPVQVVREQAVWSEECELVVEARVILEHRIGWTVEVEPEVPEIVSLEV